MIRIVSANPALERWAIGGTGKRFPKGIHESIPAEGIHGARTLLQPASPI
jgi:hypothetical protein